MYVDVLVLTSCEAQRWLIGEVTRLELGRTEVTVEYEGRVKTASGHRLGTFWKPVGSRFGRQLGQL